MVGEVDVLKHEIGKIKKLAINLKSLGQEIEREDSDSEEQDSDATENSDSEDLDLEDPVKWPTITMARIFSRIHDTVRGVVTEVISSLRARADQEDQELVGARAPDTPEVGERVVSVDDDGFKHGVVRWVGQLEEHGSHTYVGLELDEPLGSGSGRYGEKRFFNTSPNHAAFVPIVELIREKDFLSGNQPSSGRDRKSFPSPSKYPGPKKSKPNATEDVECQVCFENAVDSVFYKCGHSCACYSCAISCKTATPSVCPICRAKICDVIKLFRS